MKDPDPRRMGDGIGTADGVKFVQQGCHVILGRVRRNAEPAGNQLVRGALCQQRQDFQLAGGERDAGAALRHGAKRGDHQRVMFVVSPDQIEPLNVRQNGRDPIGERGISDIDGQPYPISRARFSQAAGLSPI